MIRSFGIINELFEKQNGSLVVGGALLSDLAERFGTPLFVYDFDVLTRVYMGLRSKLDPAIKLYYSMKANPALAIVHRLRELGAGSEIASQGELAIAMHAGYKGSQIVFAGPAKSAEELRQSIESDLLSINVESIQELREVSDFAREMRQTANVSLRINPLSDMGGVHLAMGGAENTWFGVSEEDVEEASEIIKTSSFVDFKGVHVYIGNMIFEPRSVLSNLDCAARLARKVADYCGRSAIPMVNFGGGLGIPYYEKMKPVDEEELVDGLNMAIRELQRESYFADTQFIMELGRYLVAKCGLFVARVVTTKVCRGKRYAVLDGGMNFCSFATGNLGQLVNRECPACAPTKLDSPCATATSLVGPLCTPMDAFGRSYQTPELGKGDIVAFLYMGAYGFSASPQMFLSHAGCPEVAVTGGRAEVIRQPRSIENLLLDQVVLS